MTPVVSSNIAALGHDPATNTMTVQFTNQTRYEYANVPADVYDEVLNAKSVGAAFSSLIKKGAFHYRKVS